MIILELTAKNPVTNQIIIQRFLEDGTRFIKHIPFNLAIVNALKVQLSGKGIEVVFNPNTQWIMIKKTDEVSADFKKAAEKIELKDALNQRSILEREADMLKRAGFACEIKEITQ